MMKIKFILSSIILFASCSFIFAQENTNHGLVLRGRIYDTERIINKDSVVWKAKLAMEFVNEGTEPIILINPQGQFRKWQNKINFFYKRDSVSNFDTGVEELKLSKNTVRERENQNNQNLIESLDSENPPSDFTIIIKPQERFAFDDSFQMTQSCPVVDLQKNLYLECRQKARNYDPNNTVILVSNLPIIKIDYQLSLIKYQNDANFLEKLQSRWSKFGYLPVDVNGGFSITSEGISNIGKYLDVK